MSISIPICFSSRLQKQMGIEIDIEAPLTPKTCLKILHPSLL
jgi:hypothetical protein